MRILVVNWLDRENPRSGGAEIHLHETFGRLASRGHRITALVSGWDGGDPRTMADGMEIHRVGGRHSFLLRARGYAARQFPPGSFDLVVEDLNKVPVFTPFWGHPRLLLLVHHLFGRTAFAEANPGFAAATWALERPIPRIYRNLPVVAVSDSTAIDLARRGMDRKAIEVIPNGVDLEHYTVGEPEFERPTLVYLGRLKKYKRVDLVLKAVRRLLDSGIECRAIVAGKGDHRRSLERLTDRLDLGRHVEFAGFVSEARKIELLRRSWVHVLASPKEGWGIANLEAAACGTPTVASDAPGLRDSVRHGTTGFLVPHGDVGALAGRIRTLMEDRALRSEMGAAARRFAEEFSWGGIADRWDAAVRDAAVGGD